MKASWHIDVHSSVLFVPLHVLVFDEVLDTQLDHGWLSFEHRDHLHHLWHQVRVLKLLVRLHNRNDFAVNDGAALLFNLVVQLVVLRYNFGWLLLCHTSWD